MLEEIMRILDEEKGPVTAKELARRLHVEESALEGMLEYLERKGKLSVVRAGEWEDCEVAPCMGCVYRLGCSRSDAGGAR